jgi:hypothetical protein
MIHTEPPQPPTAAVAGNVEGFERGVGSDGAFVAEAQIA